MRVVRRLGWSLLVGLALVVDSTGIAADAERPRARDLGIAPGDFEPGPLNAITDVEGVRVGHTTVTEANARTGVTAIVPHGNNMFREPVPAAIVVGNGFGKLVGVTQVQELGQIETPILLTNTLAVWDAAIALAEHTLALPGNEDVRSVNPVVGETNDGWLNDIRSRPLGREHFDRALANARTGPVEEGSVGAGTGTRAFGFKGGIGTSSRVVGGHTVGVLVQSNFGGTLTIAGADVGKALATSPAPADSADGSCMIVVATDAQLEARQLERLARRALAGMARTGAAFSHGSGDYVIAFAVAAQGRAALPDADLSPLFQACADATEEAIYNSMLRATTVTGPKGRTVEALPVERVRTLLARP